MFETNAGEDEGRHRVVVVGGGVAGLDLAGTLGRDPAFDVALVDRATAHVWKPMLHSIAAGTHNAAFAGVPFVAQSRARGFDYQPGEASALDLDARTLAIDAFMLRGHELAPRRTLSYDTLVLAVGSVADPFDTPGVREHAYHIDTLDEAQAFQSELVPRLIEASQRGEQLRLAIVGGGATGVQLAAELFRMADVIDHFALDHSATKLSITLLERGDRVLSPFPERVSAAARARLERIGIAVRTGVAVERIEADAVFLEGGERLPADLSVWAAGVKASPLAARVEGLEQGPAGRLIVDQHLRVPNRAEIFAIGDCAALVPAGEEKPLPPTAQAAYQQAVWLGRNMASLIGGRTVKPFRYRNMGAIVDLGGYEAYGALGQFGFFEGRFFRGKLAQLGHAMLYRRHQIRLHGVRRTLGLWLSDLVTSEARPVERIG